MQVHRPLCSVVIPSYNAAEYLEEAIESALAQTYVPLEVVVVDDGSSDETPEILDRFTGRIVHVRQPNAGVSAARNTALAHSSGDVVAFLNADDTFMPTRVERCIDLLLAEPGTTLVTTDAIMVDGRAVTDRHYYGGFARAGFPDADQLSAILKWNFVFVSAVVWRRALDKVGPFDSSCDRAEDFELWLRLLLDGARFSLVPEPLAKCRLVSGSLSDDSAKQWQAHLAAVDKHFRSLLDRDVPVPAGLCFEVARRRSSSGRFAGAASAALAGLRADDIPLTRRVRAGLGIARDAMGLRRSATGSEPTHTL